MEIYFNEYDHAVYNNIYGHSVKVKVVIPLGHIILISVEVKVVIPLGHIILIQSQPVFALSP